MAELEDLVLKRFRVEKIDDEMVAVIDPKGNYRAGSKGEVERALSTDEETDVDVLIGNRWVQIRGNRITKAPPKMKHGKEYWRGYNAGYSKAVQAR